MSILKISITGPESSGKSLLSQALADHFDTSYAPEFARDFLEKTAGRYTFTDLDKIAKGQLKYEKEALARAKNNLCFFDTDMLVLKIWSEFRFGKLSPFIDSAFKHQSYDYFLLCKPDLEWHPDDFRESPDQKERNQLFEIYKSELEKINANYFVVEGFGHARIESAIEVVTSLRSITS